MRKKNVGVLSFEDAIKMGEYNPDYKPRKARFVVGVKVLVFDKKGKLLILKRSSKTKVGGLWSFPGGTIDKGEDVQEAAIRETHEETKLDIGNIKIFDVTTINKGKKDESIVVGFTALVKNRKIKLNWEHDKYKWIDSRKSQEYNLTPYANYIVDRYIKWQEQE